MKDTPSTVPVEFGDDEELQDVSFASDAPLLGSHAQQVDQKSTEEPHTGQIVTLALIALIAILVTSVNLTAVHIKAFRASIPADARSLPKANMYLGLEKMVRNSTSGGWPLQHELCPGFLGVVDRAQPTVHQGNPGEVVMSYQRHSLVMQFEIRDYGLEHCTLQYYAPELSEASAKHLLLRNRYESINVWTLKTPSDSTLLTVKQLSFRTKPERDRLLGTLEFRLNSTGQTNWFICPTRSIQTLELECTAPGCAIAFTHNLLPPRFGFRLKQSEAAL